MQTQTLNFENLLKKAIFTAFIAIILFHFGVNDGNAQITIDNSYKPAYGDTYKSVSADTNGIFEGNAGANQSWNFTSLVLSTTPVTVTTSDPSTGLGNSHFPGATTLNVIDGAYIYSKEENNSYYAMGMYTEDALRKYTDMQKVMQYPFAYNNSFTDTYRSVMTIDDMEMRSHGTVTVTADAWGTIALPSGTYNNALRLKSVLNNTDTMVTSSGSFVFGSTTTTYSWYVSGVKVPVFSITYIVSDFANIKSVEYVTESSTSIINPIGIAEDYKLEQNYPNPFNPSTTITFSIRKSDFTSLKVYDILGKEVATLVNGNLSAGTYSADFDASQLTSGVYFYKLETSEFSSVKKMSLIK